MLRHTLTVLSHRACLAIAPAAIAATFLLCAPASAASPIAQAAAHCRGAQTVPAADPGSSRVAVMCLINRFRSASGRDPLRFNRLLARAAQSYSHRMAAERFFSHTAPGGGTMVDRLRQSGYIRAGAWTVGENLGWGTNALATPAHIVESWANSPGHRRNLLRPNYREAGIGIVTAAPSGTPGATYTINFGARGAEAVGGGLRAR